MQSERQQLAMAQALRHRLDNYLSLASRPRLPAARRTSTCWPGKAPWPTARQKNASPATAPNCRSDSPGWPRPVPAWPSKLSAPPLPCSGRPGSSNSTICATDKENLEGELAHASQEFRQAQAAEQLTPAQTAAALPPGTVLVDLLEYNHASPPRDGKGPLQWERRVLAFVLARAQQPVLVPLQAAAPVAEAVRAWRQGLLQGDRPAMAAAARELQQRVWKPLVPHLGQAQTVLIAADGALTQFPFAALPGRRPGSYLLEDLAIGYIASGRQLVEIYASAPARAGQGLLALGGVDYTAAPDSKPAGPSPGFQVAAQDRAGFALLPGTEPEARRCRDLFHQTFPSEPALLLTGREAHEARVKQECSRGYRCLHLATHGFFESPARVAALRAGLLRQEGELSLAAQKGQDEALGLAPLLRSGLVLAGASRPARPEEGDDGILTAEEVAALDLRRTDLVVLSACETALGTLEQGEGVLGLQRAFHAAGARTLVSSLWKVDDAGTSLLMDAFYDNLWHKKLPRLEALRQAQLLVLNHPERVEERKKELRTELAKRGLGLQSQPLPQGGKGQQRSPAAWWAAFVLSGDVR